MAWFLFSIFAMNNSQKEEVERYNLMYSSRNKIITRMRGKAKRDGRRAIWWMETFTRVGDMGLSTNVGLFRPTPHETAVHVQDKPWVTSANH